VIVSSGAHGKGWNITFKAGGGAAKEERQFLKANGDSIGAKMLGNPKVRIVSEGDSVVLMFPDMRALLRLHGVPFKGDLEKKVKAAFLAEAKRCWPR